VLLKAQGCKEARMKVSGLWIRRAVLWGATGAVTAAVIVAGSSAEAAHTTPRSQAAANAKGVGYPPPKGIYRPFTNCPLLNPLMQESTPGFATGCVAGQVISGSIKIGKIRTKVVATAEVKTPVAVQFGIWSPPNAGSNQFSGGILPPPAGLSAQLVSIPQRVPGGLLKALGCPNSNPTIRRLCNEAKHRGGKYLRVFASAQSAGPITNFQLTLWSQLIEFHLINPLLGSSCFIGSADNPVVVNPSLSTTGTAVIETDPHPRFHPDTGVIKIPQATATDTAFAAPGVTGCGPGGTANIAVDEAIDTSTGLPSASGVNSLTLSGTFYLAVCSAPQNMAKTLLSAFRASARTGGKAVDIPMTRASLRRFGIRLHRA
jgi:hypothetical protein